MGSNESSVADSYGDWPGDANALVSKAARIHHPAVMVRSATPASHSAPYGKR
jgi:hypothetical protein